VSRPDSDQTGTGPGVPGGYARLSVLKAVPTDWPTSPSEMPIGHLRLDKYAKQLRREERTHLPRSALWTVADLLADECRASPDGGHAARVHVYENFFTPSRAARSASRRGASMPPFES
jgi:hypothetical protein